MRWLLCAIPMLVCAADLKIDHVTIAGNDLKRMTADLQAAGVPMVYGGPHANGTTEMALCSFPDGSYLEAIAPVKSADPEKVKRHEWAAFLNGSPIACAWAVRSDDLAADRRRLLAAGVAASAAVKGGRERPDGARLDWETMDVGGGTRGSLFPFLIHDLTPRERRAFPSGEPVTREFSGVAQVVLAVGDLDEAVAHYRRVFGLGAPSRRTDLDVGARLAVFKGAPVVLAQPLDPRNWIGRRIANYGEGPCAIVLRAARPAGGKDTWLRQAIRWAIAGEAGWQLGILDPAVIRR